jgi:hypothetical protein
VLELPPVIERFATDFEDLPELVEGVPPGRVLVAPGLLVRAFAVYGLLVADGSIELVGLTVER